MSQYVILLARRSTAQQEQSLDYQVEEVKKRFPQYVPNKIVRITETGDDKKNNPRKKFNEEFISLVKKKIKQDYKVICLAYSIDRFTRNYFDLGILHRLYNLGAKFYASDGKLEDEQDALLFGVQVAFANNFLANMRAKQRAGIMQSLKNGKIINGKVLGYKPSGEKGIRELDGKRAIGVKKIFQDYATGKYSIRSYLPIAKELSKKYDLRTPLSSKDGISKILRNPFYYGYIRYNGQIEEIKGQLFKSASPALISKSLFDKVQNILDSKLHKKMTTHNFLYKGLIKLPSGKKLYASNQKGFVYYEDQYSKPRLKALKEEEINEVLHYFFKEAQKNLDLKKFKKHLSKNLNGKLDELLKEKKVLQLEIAKVEKRLDNLLEMRAELEITESEYFKAKIKCQNEKAMLEAKMNEDMVDKFEAFEKTANQFLELVETFNISYLKLDTNLKSEIVKNWVSNFLYDGKKLLIEPSPLFNLLFKTENYSMVVPSRLELLLPG